MAERYGGDMINSVLSTNTPVTDIVGTSIYEDLLVPTTDKSEETINYYKTDPFNGGLESFESRFSVDCRAGDYVTSRNLATNVFTALNREHNTVDSKYYFTVCNILNTIPPINDTDVYNTPVELYVRRR